MVSLLWILLNGSALALEYLWLSFFLKGVAVRIMSSAAIKPIKVYVAVKADFAENGKMIPRQITWEDGTKYEIDRVLDIRQAAAMKAGGQGDRYTVRIGGHQSYLFFERSTNLIGDNIGRWFVERRYTG